MLGTGIFYAPIFDPDRVEVRAEKIVPTKVINHCATTLFNKISTRKTGYCSETILGVNLSYEMGKR
jgi:hypothetical protein